MNTLHFLPVQVLSLFVVHDRLVVLRIDMEYNADRMSDEEGKLLVSTFSISHHTNRYGVSSSRRRIKKDWVFSSDASTMTACFEDCAGK